MIGRVRDSLDTALGPSPNPPPRRPRVGPPPAEDREPALGERPQLAVHEPRPADERRELGGAVQADVSRFEPAEEPVGDPRGPQVGARVADRDPAAGPEHPGHLPHAAGGIRVMVERVGAQDRGERAVRERQLRGVGHLEPQVRLAAGERLRLPDHLGGQVDPYHGPGHPGGRARRGTGPAPYVEHAVRGSEVERLEGGPLDRVAPPRGGARLVAAGPAVEPPPRLVPRVRSHDAQCRNRWEKAGSPSRHREGLRVRQGGEGPTSLADVFGCRSRQAASRLRRPRSKYGRTGSCCQHSCDLL